MRPKSGFRIAPNWSQIRKIAMTSQFSDMTSSPNIFDVVLFFLLRLVTDPSFMSTSGSGVMTISLYKGLTRNPEIENPPV